MGTKDVKSGRPNLDSSLISSHLVKRGGQWREIEVLETVASTNDRALELVALHPTHISIVTSDEQTKGRGRLQREWASPKGGSIALSVAVPVSKFDFDISLLPLAVGTAVKSALAEFNVEINLKWPNDLIFLNSDKSVAKVGGILLQRSGECVVIGIGLNVSLSIEELPTPIATSLTIRGFNLERESLIAAIVFQVEQLSSGNQINWLEDYLKSCATLNSFVKVTLADSSTLEGVAKSLTPSGGLVIDASGELHEITVGDVEHLRHITNSL